MDGFSMALLVLGIYTRPECGGKGEIGKES
jgi:hypothetical protein